MRRIAIITVATFALAGSALGTAHAGFEFRSEIGGRVTVATTTIPATTTTTARPPEARTAPAQTPPPVLPTAGAPIAPVPDEVERGTVAPVEPEPTTTTTTTEVASDQ